MPSRAADHEKLYTSVSCVKALMCQVNIAHVTYSSQGRGTPCETRNSAGVFVDFVFYCTKQHYHPRGNGAKAKQSYKTYTLLS